MKHISKRNMAYSLLLVHFPFIIFIIFLAVPLSNGENAKYYSACSIPYSCGHIQNLGYPFWGDNRPKCCGISDLKLNCDNGRNKTTMNIFQKKNFELSVLSINTTSHIIDFSPRKFLNICYLLNTSDITLLSTLKPDARYSYIKLFYGCTNFVSRYHFKSFNCFTYDETKGTAYYFGNGSNISKIARTCSCKNSIRFPVKRRQLDELISTNDSLRTILTKEPIETEYIANFTACSKCEKSGGRCGSSEDQFICYCREGNNSLTCSSSYTPGPGPSKHNHVVKKKERLELILGLGIGGTLLVLVAIIGILYCKKFKFVTQGAPLDSFALELEKGSTYFSVPLFSFSELAEATANFDQSKELGNGGFGIVYYGKLKDGREVAVKRLYEKSYKRLEQFMNEVHILTLLRHQNLVSLYGCTSQHCRELLLVYEYVKNGTVADHLYGTKATSGSLPWLVRLRIAIETATALSYLHVSDIIHRDVKTNNILLDSNLCVKVADFGLSRLFPTDVTHVSTAPQGTPGYLDPEYHQCYQLTDKSDVYSFGVVLIELISSLPAIDMERHRLEINLSNYAMNRIQRRAFDELVDPQLGFALDFKVRRMTTMVAELAFQCLQHDKDFRPSMDEVLEVLKSIEGADYEALQVEEMVENAGIEECEALQAEMAKNAGGKVTMHASNPPPSLAEDDHAQVLNNHLVFSSSPISVIDKWISTSSSTIPSTSKVQFSQGMYT